MKGTTVVLVVLNSYVRYGEDLDPIDKLEKKVKQTFSGFGDVKVSFFISNEDINLVDGDGVDAIAFYYPRMEVLYNAFKRGIPVLNYESKSDNFRFVSVKKNGPTYEVCPISFGEMIEKVANTNK